MAKTASNLKRQKPVEVAAPPARTALTVRLRNQLRRDIERSAAKYGRSLSEEIEHRLEVSFAFTQYVKHEWGDDVFKIAQSMAASLSFIEDWTGKEWISDPETFETFCLASCEIIRNYRDLVTKAPGRTWPQGDLHGKTPSELGQMFAALGGLAPPRVKKPMPPADESEEQLQARARSKANMQAILSEEPAGEDTDA